MWFIPIKVTFPLDKLAKLYAGKIVGQYGTLMSIVSDRDSLIEFVYNNCYHSSIALEWLLIMHCMGGIVEHQFVGKKKARESFMGHN